MKCSDLYPIKTRLPKINFIKCLFWKNKNRLKAKSLNLLINYIKY